MATQEPDPDDLNYAMAKSVRLGRLIIRVCFLDTEPGEWERLLISTWTRYRTHIIALFILAVAAYWAERSGLIYSAGYLVDPKYWRPPPRDHDYDSDEDSYTHGSYIYVCPDSEYSHCNYPLPAIRSEFSSFAATVYGWPSGGGLWVREHCCGVELQFLNISRLEPSATQRYSDEEDDFCKRMEKIGARFYETERAYSSENSFYEGINARGPQLWCGWPENKPVGGVWALWTQATEEAQLGVSRIRNALSMKERCKAIEMLGGEFYGSWEEVPGRQQSNSHLQAS